MSSIDVPLLIGEVFVDFTLTAKGIENKLRLGGVAHAARGFWALRKEFRAAVVLPDYLEGLAQSYFARLGCIEFVKLGTVTGAPNLTVIIDPTETADQGYETILRDEKHVSLPSLPEGFRSVRDVLVFPGTFDLDWVCKLLPDDARLHLDVAYDIAAPEAIAGLPQGVETIFISTSSDLFRSVQGDGVRGLSKVFFASNPAAIILKENRGGSRLIEVGSGNIEALPAQLGRTENSVGVGDVFAAAYLARLDAGRIEAAWRATYVASAYSQTTFPDLFQTYVQRDQRLDLNVMRGLWGSYLPWERRPQIQIYLAAPDFESSDRAAIQQAVEALTYHNFKVRRPVIENGELPTGADKFQLRETYDADYALLKRCALVFAVPTARDPGTLIEVGIAIEMRIPVVVFDATNENANTMVMAGASHYSGDLGSCLDAVFLLLSEPPPGS